MNYKSFNNIINIGIKLMYTFIIAIFMKLNFIFFTKLIIISLSMMNPF